MTTAKDSKKALNIYQRLHAAMEDVSFVRKEDKKVNNQYTFVSHDEVTKVTREVLLKHGVIYHPQNLNAQQNGNRTEVQMELHFVNIDDPEDRIAVPSFGYGVDNQDKGPGKAMSYAVKYGLLKALALETGDDPEKDNIDHKPNGIKPLDKTNNRAIDDWVKSKMVGMTEYSQKDEATIEGLEKGFKLTLNHASQSGCTQEQKDLLEQQFENSKKYLTAKIGNEDLDNQATERMAAE